MSIGVNRVFRVLGFLRVDVQSLGLLGVFGVKSVLKGLKGLRGHWSQNGLLVRWLNKILGTRRINAPNFFHVLSIALDLNFW